MTVNVKVNADEFEIEKIAKEVHEKLIKHLQSNITCRV